MAERIVQEESLVAVADAIRAKGDTTDALSFPTGFADAISAIQAGGGGSDIGFYTGVIIPENKLYKEDIIVPVHLKDTSILPTFGLYVIRRKVTASATSTRQFEALIANVFLDDSGKAVANAYFYGYATNMSKTYIPFCDFSRSVGYAANKTAITQFSDFGLAIGMFSSFGGVELAAGCEYEWFAIGDGITG